MGVGKVCNDFRYLCNCGSGGCGDCKGDDGGVGGGCSSDDGGGGSGDGSRCSGSGGHSGGSGRSITDLN